MEAKKEIATESGHWYDKDGNPAYTQPNKSKGGERATTIKDARKLGLFPSVTGITKQLAAPGLINWMLTQAYESAYTCPVKRSEVSGSEWIARVKADAQAQAEQAREKGELIHAIIEKGLQGRLVADEYQARFRKVYDIVFKYGEPIAEKSFTYKYFDTDMVKEIGYGGKIDIKAGNLIADIKTTEFTLDADGVPNKKLGYPENILQLSAYAQGISENPSDSMLLNIYVSTISDDVYVKEWTTTEFEQAIKKFNLLVKLWWLNF